MMTRAIYDTPPSGLLAFEGNKRRDVCPGAVFEFLIESKISIDPDLSGLIFLIILLSDNLNSCSGPFRILLKSVSRLPKSSISADL